MIAMQFEIIDKQRERTFQPTSIKDFHLRETGSLPASEILETPHITLYSLDFENSQAVFVETPAQLDLSQAPFYFVAQFEHATRVLTLPFDTMIQLAQSVSLDDSRLIFIHSVGRCGSTLASQIFAQIPGIINISEPEVLTLLTVARHAQPGNEDQLIALSEAVVRMLCKTPAETAWVIKERSYAIEVGDWLHQSFPQSRHLFLYRNAETWLRSMLRAFGDNVQRTDQERKTREQQRRNLFGAMLPSIANYDPNVHLSHAGVLSLVWLAIMARYEQLQKMGVDMLAIRYTSWQTDPRKTAEAMLDYCGCRPADMTAIYETLDRDSQAGSGLSQDTLDQRSRDMTEHDLEELKQHLQNHAFIQEADYEATNTLQR